MKHKFNGKGKEKKLNLNGPSEPLSMHGQQIKYPVTYNLKAVMAGTRFDDENKADITNVFSKLNIAYTYLDKKISTKGTYTSFTYKITIVSHEQMYKMYAELRAIKNLKFAL